MTCCQWAIARFYHLCAHSKRRRWWMAVNRGFLVWVYRHGNHGTRAGCWWFYGQPSFLANSSCTNEAILSDHPQLSTVLTRCGLPRSPHGLAWHQSSIGNMHPEDVVDGNQTHATSNSTLPHAFTGKCKRSMPNTYRVGLGIIRPISENWEKICSCWFELATVRRQIWGYDQLSCGFGFRRSHLALKWKFGQGEAQFLWEQSQIHFMSFSAQWRHTKSIHIDFIASYGGVTTPFFQECIYSFMTFPA